MHRLCRLLLITVVLCLPLAAGAFTTAAEVKPILNATKSSWIAVREYDGNDLVYFTHLESWRCGLDGVKFGINSDTADQIWELETCYEGEAAPNAMKAEGRLPYVTLPLGSVQSIVIELTYDDGTTDTVVYQRDAVKMP